MPRARSRPVDAIGEEGPLTPTVRDYAHNLITGTLLPRRSIASSCTIAAVHGMLDLVGPQANRRSRPRARRADCTGVILQRRVTEYLSLHGGPPRPPGCPLAPVDGNLALIGTALGLDDAERQVLLFLLALRASQNLREASAAFGEVTLAGAGALIADATALATDCVLSALRPNGRLLGSGLVSVDHEDTHELLHKVKLKTGLLDAVLTPHLDKDTLAARFLSEAEPPTLAWADFDHLKGPAEVARDLLRAALQGRKNGVNVLLYGETGTGKTELARLLASDIPAKLYIAGQADDQGESATARERLSSLLLGQRVVSGGSAILLFDELEDLFTWESGGGFFGPWSHAVASMSKQWFNELLEKNAVPTIWITNNAEGVDRAFLRRFSYAMKLRAPGPRQRARVLARHLGSERIVTNAEIVSIAERYIVSSAQIGSAVAAARLIAPEGRPDRASIESVLAPVEKLLTGVDGSRRPIFDAAGYRIDALNSPEDLAGMATRLAEWKPGSGPGISLCLYGPPGTGKSEFVRYLAHRMGRPILYRRASDLLSCWIGGTERLIAEAFTQAVHDDAVLLLDEADSFLRDRREAVRSWEVTEVNELLQQLESFQGVVACTTNLWRDIDEASLRRFVFKIELRPLRVGQAMTLFRSMFAADLETPLDDADEMAIRDALGRLSNLTPGDFAVVSRRLRALGQRAGAADLVAALTDEIRMKRLSSSALGF